MGWLKEGSIAAERVESLKSEIEAFIREEEETITLIDQTLSDTELFNTTFFNLPGIQAELINFYTDYTHLTFFLQNHKASIDDTETAEQALRNIKKNFSHIRVTVKSGRRLAFKETGSQQTPEEEAS